MRIRGVIYGAIWAAIWLPLPAGAQGARPLRAVPDCAGRVEIAKARVVRVERNGALILSDGRAILLEGIRLPGRESGRDGDGALAGQSLALLGELAKAAPVTFTATPPKQDRYDRVRAQAFGDGVWLQVAMLERGMARVAISPDRNECAPDLYEAEARARRARAGLWAMSSYAPRQAQTMAQEMKGSAGSFQLVEGWVTNVGTASGRTFIDFGNDGSGNRVFSAVIQAQDRAAFRGHDLQDLVARHVRIRGVVVDVRGRPEIGLSNPAQIEILD